jgi:hypothetical protein
MMILTDADQYLHRSECVLKTGLIVMMEYPSDDLQQLGYTELMTVDFLAQTEQENYGTYTDSLWQWILTKLYCRACPSSQ